MERHSRWFLLFVILSLLSIFFFPATSYAGQSWMKYFRKDTLLNTYMRAYAVSGEKLYVGTYGDGMVIYTGDQTRNVNSKNSGSAPGANDGLISDNITTMCLDERNQRLWIGTIEGLCSCSLDATDWKRFTSRDGLANDVIRDIAIDASGLVWVGTPSGVSVYDGSGWTTYDTQSGLNENSVHSITVQGDAVWVASVGGSISRFKDGAWKLFMRY